MCNDFCSPSLRCYSESGKSPFSQTSLDESCVFSQYDIQFQLTGP